MMVDRALTKLQQKYPDLEVEKIDVVTSPLTALNEGIRMIPALKDGENILSGIWLSGGEIKKFIDKARQR